MRGCWGGLLLVPSGASSPRTEVYVICAHNVWRTGRAGHSRAQVVFLANADDGADGPVHTFDNLLPNTVALTSQIYTVWGMALETISGAGNIEPSEESVKQVS